MAPPGRRRFAPSTTAIILGLLFLFTGTASAASAVLGIDLGTEYIKAAIVKPGIPLEIVLTKDSKRKEAAAVALKPLKPGTEKDIFPERAYGADALALSARFPGEVYSNIKPLLGAAFESSAAVKEYARRYPAIELVQMEDRPTVAFKSKAFSGDEYTFSVEEILAMELKNIRENAKAMAGKGSDVSDVVFTIPSYYTADEKRALEAAASLAGLKVLGLVTDGLAVGLNYATSRTFPDVTNGSKPEYHLVFDMGAGSTTANVLRFQSRSVKDVGRFNKTVQEVAVVGSGWDRTLGGDALNTLIVDDMVTKFLESPGGKKLGVATEDIQKHGRTMAKLWKDAEKLRQVLSANSETGSSFESLYEDTDFKYKLSRTTFEEMTTGFAARVDGPIIQALGSAGLSWSDIDSVILHGGASRTPFIQKRLETLAGDESKIRGSVNADEAAVFGAAFKAATISPSFRVKEIRDSDTIGYPVGVQYMWNLKDRLQNLFTPTSKIGVSKDIPFKMMGDFEFTLYQNIPYGGEEPARVPIVHSRTGNMTTVVTKLIQDDGCDREAIDTKFSVRLSPVNGLPEVLKGWVSCEVDELEKKEGVMDSVKGFFGFGDKKDGQEPLVDTAESEAADAETVSTASSSSSAAASESTPIQENGDVAPTPGSEVPKDSKPKKRTVKSAVTFHLTQKGYEKHPRKEFKRMLDRLSEFDASDKARRAREELHNSLEAFTYRARDHLDDAAFIECSTTEDRAKLEELLSETSDWLYAEGSNAGVKVLEERLKALKDIVDPVVKRKTEARGRPEKLKALKDALEQTKSFRELVAGQVKSVAEASSSAAAAASSKAAEASAANSASSADPLAELEEDIPASASTTEAPKPMDMPELRPYTEEDFETVDKVVSDIEKWFDEKLAEQDKLQPYQDAAFTIAQLEAKASQLNQAMMAVIQKKMRAPPRSSKSKSSRTKSKKSKTSATATTTISLPTDAQETPVVDVPPSEEEIVQILEDLSKEDAPADGEEKKRKHDEL